MSTPPGFPCRFMAVDAGSNSIKYRVWEIEARGEARQLAERRFPVRLGAGVFDDGLLKPKSMSDAVDVFEQIRDDAREQRVDVLRAVTTSAMREARNAAELVEAIKRRSGIELEILPELEEARLVGLGALGERLERGECCLMIDIGGGSTELILARRPGLFQVRSLRLGAVRLTAWCFERLPPEPGQVDRARRIIDEALGRMEPLPEVEGELSAVGCAGTINAIESMIRRVEPDSPPGLIRAEQMGRILERAGSMDARQVAEHYGLDLARAEIILAGALVLESVMRRLRLGRLELVRGGVGDGLLREFLERCGLLPPLLD